MKQSCLVTPEARPLCGLKDRCTLRTAYLSQRIPKVPRPVRNAGLTMTTISAHRCDDGFCKPALEWIFAGTKNPMPLHLTDIETRVLGSLIEKDITTPDYYP